MSLESHEQKQSADFLRLKQDHEQHVQTQLSQNISRGALSRVEDCGLTRRQAPAVYPFLQVLLALLYREAPSISRLLQEPEEKRPRSAIVEQLGNMSKLLRHTSDEKVVVEFRDFCDRVARSVEKEQATYSDKDLVDLLFILVQDSLQQLPSTKVYSITVASSGGWLSSLLSDEKIDLPEAKECSLCVFCLKRPSALFFNPTEPELQQPQPLLVDAFLKNSQLSRYC